MRVFSPDPEGRALTLWGDPGATADELSARSRPDAAAYVRFDRKLRALGSFLAHIHATTPPDLKSPSLADAFTGMRLGRALRGLGSKEHAREALRVLPMAVADFVSEVFEDQALRGLLAARGVQYSAMGPWSAGTTAVLLADAAGNDVGAAGHCVYVKGGPGALADALGAAALSFGAGIRTGAEVEKVTSAGGHVTGVVLSSGEEIGAPIVVSGADPKRTLLGLVDPVDLGATLVWRTANLRLPGVMSKVNLALSGVPRFAGTTGPEDMRLRGRIVIAPSIDHLEKGFDASKYGRFSDEPFLEATLPTLMDNSLAPDGVHVMSVLVQWTPFELRDSTWDAERERLGDLVVQKLEAHAPGLGELVEHRQIITPPDLERDHGLTGGHPLHGEPGLDQFFAWRPLLGHARYRMPIGGLYLCGSGAHPGGGVTGGPGANAAREILADAGRRRD